MQISKFFYLISLICIFLLFYGNVLGHEAHQEAKATVSEKQIESENATKIIQWVGNFHPIIMHFPIALIVMTAISELLFFWYRTSLFDQASRFMIIAAAITAIPTALTGLAYGYDVQYEDIMATYFWWHRFLGIFIMLLAIITATLRELSSQKKAAYYLCLFVLFISVNVTGFLGGSLTFGIGHLWPPFLLML